MDSVVVVRTNGVGTKEALSGAIEAVSDGLGQRT